MRLPLAVRAGRADRRARRDRKRRAQTEKPRRESDGYAGCPCRPPRPPGAPAEDQWIRRLSRKLAADPHRPRTSAGRVGRGDHRACVGYRPRALRPCSTASCATWIDLKRVGEEAGGASSARRGNPCRRRATSPPTRAQSTSPRRPRARGAVPAARLPALLPRFLARRDSGGRRRLDHAVHERLQRGLARLRARLDREHGRRRARGRGVARLARPSDCARDAGDDGDGNRSEDGGSSARGRRRDGVVVGRARGARAHSAGGGGAGRRGKGGSRRRPAISSRSRAPDGEGSPCPRLHGAVTGSPEAVPELLLLEGRVVETHGAPVAG